MYNIRAIVLYQSAYRSEALEIGEKLFALTETQVTFKEVNLNFIPYCSDNILFYDEGEKGKFDQIVIIFPVCDYDSEYIFRNLSSIENSDSLVLLVSFPDKRLMGTPIYPKLQEIYNKAYSVNDDIMLEKATRYYNIIRKYKSYNFTDADGSDLHFSRESSVLIDVFNCELKGTFQLPAGEVFFAIEENSAHGSLYINKKKYLVEKNILHSLDHNDEYNGLIICEFGLGVNENIPRCLSLDIAEKSFGTCHFGFGSNCSFGGKIDADYHFDITYKSFKFYADKTLLIKYN